MFTLTACVVMTVQGDQGEPRVSEHPLQGVPEEADMYQYGEDTQRAFLTRGFLQNILSGNGHKTTEESGDILKFPLGGATVYSNFGTHNSLALRTGIHSSKAYLADLDMVNKWNAEHGHSKATIVPDEDRVEGENGSLLLLHMDFFLFADEEVCFFWIFP